VFAGQYGQYGTVDGPGTSALLAIPRFLSLDSADNLYAVDSYTGYLRKITSTGNKIVCASLKSISQEDLCRNCVNYSFRLFGRTTVYCCFFEWRSLRCSSLSNIECVIIRLVLRNLKC
jgi:hypothetical protein